MKKGMNFERARRVVMALLVCGLVLSIAGAMFTVEGDPVRTTLVAVSLACIAAAVVFTLTFCRCPSCGKLIIVGMLKVKVCPSCHRDINTGAKVKGKNKRR